MQPTTLHRGLLDTNAVILLPQIDRTRLPIVPMISAVTLAELCAGPLTAPSETTRELRQRQLDHATALFTALAFDKEAAVAFGHVSASMRRAGRKSHARSLDAMIAATAVAHGLPLYTCDPADFAGIEGLQVVAVPHPVRN